MNGSGCKSCPVSPCNRLYYRGSYCAAQRAKHGLGDPMTNADLLMVQDGKSNRDALLTFFREWAGIGDSYIYDLTRVKTAFGVGTMSLEDFEEWDDDRITQLVDDFLEWLGQPAEEDEDGE